MQKNEKILIVYFVYFFVLWTSVLISINFSLENPLDFTEFKKEVEFKKNVKVERTDLFEKMSMIEKYPEILPNYITSVDIINKTNNIIFAREQISVAGITMELVVKHEINPYDEHKITILSGDAKNSTIIISYNDLENSTKVIMNAKMNLKGLLIPFGVLPENIFQKTMNDIIQKFVNFKILEK